jgi:hypothetical protein
MSGESRAHISAGQRRRHAREREESAELRYPVKGEEK